MCLSRSGVREHQRLQPRIEQEGRDGVDELHLEQLHGRHVGEQHAPGVALAQIDLLQILIESPLREEMRRGLVVLGQQRHLRQRRGVHEPHRLRVA